MQVDMQFGEGKPFDESRILPAWLLLDWMTPGRFPRSWEDCPASMKTKFLPNPPRGSVTAIRLPSGLIYDFILKGLGHRPWRRHKEVKDDEKEAKRD